MWIHKYSNAVGDVEPIKIMSSCVRQLGQASISAAISLQTNLGFDLCEIIKVSCSVTVFGKLKMSYFL